MKVITVELLVLFTLYALEICNSILGGGSSDVSKFPFVVQIVSKPNFTHICAGSLITKQHVLTSASCFLSGHKNKLVLVRVSNSQFFYETADVILEDPNLKNMCDNLAIVKLPRPIPSHPNLKAIAVSSEEFLHTLCPVTGLGWTESDLQPPPYSLQELFITAQPHEQCELDVNMKLTHGQFCTLGGETTGFDTFDMGGPIVLNTTLVGIITGCNMDDEDSYVDYTHDFHIGLHNHVNFITANTDDTLELRSIECHWDPDSTLPF